MEIKAIENNIEKLEQIKRGLETSENYMCIDCYIRRLVEYVTFLKNEDGCGDLVELIRTSIVQYYINRLETDEIVKYVGKLIEVLKGKIQ